MQIPCIDVIPPQLSIVCFRLCVDKNNDSNQLTKHLLEGITSDGRVLLSSTIIDNVYWIRLCVSSIKNSVHGVEMTVKIIKQQVMCAFDFIYCVLKYIVVYYSD